MLVQEAQAEDLVVHSLLYRKNVNMMGCCKEFNYTFFPLVKYFSKAEEDINDM